MEYCIAGPLHYVLAVCFRLRGRTRQQHSASHFKPDQETFQSDVNQSIRRGDLHASQNLRFKEQYLVCRERKGSARLFFQSSSSLKCCSFKAGGVLEDGTAAWLQLPVSLLKTLEEPVT